jgi:uncharacterized protein
MAEEYPRASLFGTEARRLYSTLLGREYQLSVWLPPNYALTRSRYPIVYLLDGEFYFGMAAGLTPGLHWLDIVPELIVVGINYGIQNFDEFFHLRELDFKIPAVQDEPPGSHADLFLAALAQEFIPFVENNYRADPGQRILYGYSSSGFFVLYTLFNQPDLFRRYLAGSGDTDLSAPYLLSHDQALASRKKSGQIDLYLSIGKLEKSNTQSSLPTFNQLVKTINAKNYPGVRLISEVYQAENHGAGGAALTYLNGLRKCFTPGNGRAGD